MDQDCEGQQSLTMGQLAVHPAVCDQLWSFCYVIVYSLHNCSGTQDNSR